MSCTLYCLVQRRRTGMQVSSANVTSASVKAASTVPLSLQTSVQSGSPSKRKKIKKQSYIWLLVPVVGSLVHPSLQLCSLFGVSAGQVPVSAIVQFVVILV